MAAGQGHITVMNKLVKTYRANAEGVDTINKRTAVYYAIESGKLDAV